MKKLLLSALCLFGAASFASADTLFHETFGDNSNSARAWDNSYSVKSGVESVYQNATYTIVDAKQSKNNGGKVASGLIGTNNKDAYFLVGPLDLSNASDVTLSYYWKAASIKATYSTSIYYGNSAQTVNNEIEHEAVGDTKFVEVSVTLPDAALTSGTYIKIVFNTSNTQAVIDEFDLSGTIGVASSKDEVSMSWSEDAYTATLGQDNTFPTLTVTPAVSPIVYTSSKPEVATIADGVVTLVGAGETTIKADFAGDDDYKAAAASYTLTVVEPAPYIGDYSTLSYDVVFEYGKIMGSTNGNNADAMSNYVVTISSSSAALGNTDYKNYRFYKNNDIVISSNTNNIVKVVFTPYDSDNLPSSITYSGNEGRYNATTYTWTGCSHSVALSPSDQVRASKVEVYVSPFTIVEDEASIMGYNDICYDEDNDRWIAMFVALNDEAPYNNTDKDIVVTGAAAYERECEPETWHAICLPFDVDPAELYVTWSDMGYTVIKLIEEQTTDNGYLTFEVLDDDAIMEAQVPYLVSSELRGLQFMVGETTLSKVNLQTLHEGNNVSMTGTLVPTELTSDGAKVHYALKDGVFRHAGTKTKTLKPYRAYVTITGSGAANGLNVRIEDTNETEGIEAVEIEQMQENTFYNLKGQKVNKPTAGFYIFNGQNVLVK